MIGVYFRSMIQLALDGMLALKPLSKPSDPWLVIPLTDFIADSIRQYTNAPTLLASVLQLEEEQSIQDYVVSFLKTCRAILASLIRNYGLNRARQRDALASSLVDFYSLQDDAEKLDEIFNHVLSVQLEDVNIFFIEVSSSFN